jgi:WD40 repeat protein
MILTMHTDDTTGIQRSDEDASLHGNDSGRDRQQPFLDLATLPMNLIIGSILPFVQDRSTWNHLCVANKELRDAGRTMTPPWPETTLQQMQNFTMAMVFSPCGQYLAYGTVGREESPPFVQILDCQYGEQTSLRGHLRDISCLAFSDDGKYLASGGNERLIRIWPSDSTRKPTQQLRDKSLPGHTTEVVNCLAFASDSNILASGSRDEIKLWNVEDGVCIHNLRHRRVTPSSLVFKGVGESIQCLAATTDGLLIRISRNSSPYDFTSDVFFDGATLSFCTVFSSCGSFLATVRSKNVFSKINLCLYEIETEGWKMVQIVTLPTHINAAISFSADSKTLAVVNDTIGEDDIQVRLLDVKDLKLQRQLKCQSRGSFPVSLAVDPSNRYLAIPCSDGRVRVWTV